MVGATRGNGLTLRAG